MNRVFIKFVLCMAIGLFLIGNVSAWEWDNVRSYDEKTKTVTITNALGLGADLMKVQLLENTNECGSYCYAIFEIDNLKEFSLPLGYSSTFRVDFEDNGNKDVGSSEIKKYQFKIYSGIEDVIDGNGTIIGTREIWNEWDWKDKPLPIGKYKIKLEGYRTAGMNKQNIDWKPTFIGEKINEWAWWNLTNITFRYGMNETPVGSNTLTDDTGNYTTVMSGTGSWTRLSGSSGVGADYGVNLTGDGGALTGFVAVADVQGISFSFWINSTTLTDKATIYSNGYDVVGGGGRGWLIKTNTTSSGLNLEYLDTLVWSLASTEWANVLDGKWHHIAFVVNNSYDWIFYRDGNRVGTHISTDNLVTAPSRQGKLFRDTRNQSAQFNGELDLVTRWVIELTDENVLVLNGTVPTVTLNAPANNTASTGILTFNCSSTSTVGLTEMIFYINGISNETIHNDTVDDALISMEKVVTLNNDGYYNWSCRAWDKAGGNSLAGSRNFTVDKTNPVVSVANNLTNIVTAIVPVNSSWNYTVSDNIKLDDCYYNTSDNATLTFVTCNVSDIKTQWQTKGAKTVKYCANDTVGQETCRNASLTIDYYNYTQTGSLSLTEGSAYTFTLSVSNDGIPTTSARLWFNGTAYNPTINTHTTDSYYFSRSLNIPNDVGNWSGKNDTWYWSVNLTSKAKFNTTSQNASVYAVAIDNCSTFGTVILNLSLRDEATDSLLTILPTQNTTIEIDMSLTSWVDSTSTWNFSSSWKNDTNVTICVPDGLFTGTSTAYALNVNEIRYFADNYATEYYYIDSFNLSNATIPKFIALRDLLLDDSTSFVVSYTNENNLLIEDAIISVLRKYEDSGVFKVVENGKTSNDGETILHLVEEDVVYIFNVSIAGVQEYTSAQYRVYCEAGTTCTIVLDEGSEVGDFPTDWDNLPEGTYNLSVDKDTRTITLSFNLNETASMNLTLYQYSQNDSLMDIAITSNVTSASSGNAFVYIPIVYGNESFYATVYKDSVWVASHFVDMGNDLTDYIGLPLTAFIVALFIMALGLMAVAHGVGVIIFGIFAIFIAVAMGLITSSGTWSIISIVCAGIIVMGMVYKRRSKT